MKTDIQIARESELRPISDIAEQLGIAPEKVEPYGRFMAKVPVSLIDEERVGAGEGGIKRGGDFFWYLVSELLVHKILLEIFL